MKIVNSVALLVALGVQMPMAFADSQPASVKVGHEHVEALSEAASELSVAAMEEIVGGLSRRTKCLLFFGTVATVGITATIVTGGGAGILGGVIVGQIGKVGATACLL
ncbi:MAG: hypothetical protein F4Y16_15350 [Holophagales bacterium]|nr:hypothetical protein [Holophagales bacterium]MYH24218.1 hypothetical protein [Holophagales bacterium]